MGSNPINLFFRFILEMIAITVIVIWGWHQSVGLLKFVLAIGLPVCAAAIWGVFAVPNDPSRSGKAPIPVRGFIRLILELVFFSIATWMLFDLRKMNLGLALGISVAIHYLISYDRIIWLLAQNKSGSKFDK